MYLPARSRRAVALARRDRGGIRARSLRVRGSRSLLSHHRRCRYRSVCAGGRRTRSVLRAPGVEMPFGSLADLISGGGGNGIVGGLGSTRDDAWRGLHGGFDLAESFAVDADTDVAHAQKGLDLDFLRQGKKPGGAKKKTAGLGRSGGQRSISLRIMGWAFAWPKRFLHCPPFRRTFYSPTV